MQPKGELLANLDLRAAETRIRELTTGLTRPVGEADILYHAQVGATILALVYGGDLEAWRRRGKRDSSVRQLAEQLSDLLPQSAVYRSLAIYEVLLRHAARFPNMRTLGVRALTAIARAPDEDQVALVERALDERWSGTRIESHVRDLPKRTKVGRPRKPISMKALARLTSALEAVEAAPLDELDAVTLRQCLEKAHALADRFDGVLLALDKATQKRAGGRRP